MAAPDHTPATALSDLTCTVAALYVHPVKSCAGVAVTDSLLIETGLEFDRAWMVIAPDGEMLTQRDEPRMALIRPTLKTHEMVLRAPGMLALHVALDRVETARRATVWNDDVAAYDMGDLAAQWFTDFLGGPRRPLRLVRFDPEQRRLADRQWTGAIEAEAAFADAFPLLVTSTASLRALNERLAARGQPAVGIERFRPNVVLDGIEAFDEDSIDEIEIETAEGPVTLKLVKPCVRCTIPSVDPATGVQGHEPGDTLAGFRADARMNGGITFGMNAVVVNGFERTLAPGQRATARYAFD
jgi:uncharacterized protein